MAVIVPAAQITSAQDPLEERLRRLEATLTALAEAKAAAPVAKLAPEPPARSTTGTIRDFGQPGGWMRAVGCCPWHWVG